MFNGPAAGWLFVLLAGMAEICYAVFIPRTDGFTRLWPTLYCLTFIALSLWLLSLSVRTLPIGTAYAVWVGMGAVGTAVWGILFFGESANAARITCLMLIVAGVVGLKLFSPVLE
ncbi:DMT family transporter [Stutzerimonas tarimensis]|uniref:Guanidinium exporter n=1 Tax=Stutzerimonas tarimensis TaxID=1507735 RepID=A0ABV7T8W8_9GAMM